MKRLKKTAAYLCVICLTAVTALLSACSDPVELSYAGKTFNATVGVAFTASVATATGADDITYSFADENRPSWLTLTADGTLGGTPAAEATAEFTVKATSGKAEATAEFTVTVYPEGTVINTLVCEAEYADLTDMKNLAPSYAPIIFFGDLPEASNGKYLGDLGWAGNTVRFAVGSSKAVSATLEVTMTSCIIGSAFECDPEVMELKVNGKKVTYGGITFPYRTFATLSVDIELVAGENVIEFVTTDNKKVTVNNVPVMPNFDCIVLTAAADLNWTPNTDNESIY